LSKKIRPVRDHRVVPDAEYCVDFEDSGRRGMVLRLLLALESSISSDGIREILHKDHELEIVGDLSYACADIRFAILRYSPRVVLVDRDLPACDGINLAHEIIRTSLGRPPTVIVLADTLRAGDAARAAKAGVRGYLIKDQEAWTLGAAIRAVAAGAAWLSPPAAGELLDELQGGAHDGAPAPELIQLTARERSVVRLVIRGCSNTEIARELSLSESTVKTHMSRMFTRLDLRSRTQLAAFARDHGFV
jgi:DNA-binding NarL/FixJ family response regulator